MNARRCPATESVSLPRKRQKLDHSSDDSGSSSSASKNPLATRGTRVTTLRNSKRPESEDASSATKWFDDANQNVPRHYQGISGYDSTNNPSHAPDTAANRNIDEPPFFISNCAQKDSYELMDGPTSESRRFGPTTKDSENEDLRGVIDDLTIENKALKETLKRRKGQKMPQDPDKLFELRVHGLPSDKKRQLEALLRSFASGLNINPPLSSGLFSVPTSGIQAPLGNNPAIVKGVQTDSGYASNSNSGQTSAAPSHPGRAVPVVSKKSNDKSVKSYLHNIPNGLLPRRPPVMSEKSRMALVVRRLETLFTGKKATPGEHSQPEQQQEVSRQAANAEEQSGKKPDRREGTREAHILPFDSTADLDRSESPGSSLDRKKTRLISKASNSDRSPEGENISSSSSRSPDQRPTRPLDLDIHRAQIAQENIEYIRHLGLSSPKIDTKPSDQAESWIYLNLLINMAQLHTINVTPAFIRKSIKQFSAKFELSKDGEKVRWKGSNEATQLLREPSLVSETSDYDMDDLESHNAGRASAKNTSFNTKISATPSEDKSSNQLTSLNSSGRQPQTSLESKLLGSIATSRSKPASAFDYKPVLFTGKSLALHQLSYLENSSGTQPLLEDTSMEDSNGSSSGREDPDNGPIVFFSSPLFMSDLSGDRSPTNMRRSTSDHVSCPFGVDTAAAGNIGEIRDPDVTYFKKNGLTPITEPLANLSFDLPPINESGEEEGEPIELQASGIGGVTPQDNFVLDVTVKRSSTLDRSVSSGRWRRRKQMYSYHVDACSRIDLQPSLLPPPSYIFLQSSSSSDMDDATDSEDDGTDPSIDEYQPAPPMFLAHFSTEDFGSNGEDGYGPESIDMLANARAHHPSVVAGQEREFDINNKPTPMGSEFVEDSLAVTAGKNSAGSDASEGSVGSDSDEVDSDVDTDDDDEI